MCRLLAMDNLLLRGRGGTGQRRLNKCVVEIRHVGIAFIWKQALPTTLYTSEGVVERRPVVAEMHCGHHTTEIVLDNFAFPLAVYRANTDLKLTLASGDKHTPSFSQDRDKEASPQACTLASGSETTSPDSRLRCTASVNSMYFTPSANVVNRSSSSPRMAPMNSSSTRHLPAFSGAIGISCSALSPHRPPNNLLLSWSKCSVPSLPNNQAPDPGARPHTVLKV